jgi:hypothetical protein
MLGLSKVFIGVTALAAIVGFGTHSFLNFFAMMLVYIVLKVIYNLLT